MTKLKEYEKSMTVLSWLFRVMLN